MKTSNLASRIPSGLLFRLAVSLLLVPLSAGCSVQRSSGIDVSNAAALQLAGPPKHPDDVEVWLDEAPRGEFVVFGELAARSVESPASIAKMQKEAAALGLDGIYWIDCTSACSGDCKAKGFVYRSGAKLEGQNLDGRNIASR